MALIVLDASAAIAVLLNVGTSAPAIRERLAGSDEEPHVPHLFEIEVSSSLRRHALVHNLSEKRGSELLEDLARA